jgi:MFS family permease
LRTDSMRGAYRDVVAIRDARTLITASAVSQLGDWLYNAALLGYVYGATRSAGWVGAATIVRLLPYVLLGPLGGAVADRFSRRTVLLVGDVARVVLMAALAVVVATHGPIVVALALTALSSAAGGAERPAAMAWLPRLVGESRLGPANALLHTAQDLGTVLGPVLGALLLAVTSPWIAFAANGMTFAVSALLIGSIRRDRRPAQSAARGHGGVRHGVRAARATPFVAVLFCAVAMVELTYGAQTVQLVVYARRSLGLGAGGYGDLLAAAGVGGLISAVISGRLATHRRVSVVVVAAALAMCLTQLVYGASEVAVLAIVVAAIGGLGLVTCEVVTETLLVRIAPRDALGRIMGLFDAVSVGAMVLGAILAPVVIAASSLRTSLFVLGGAAALVAVACLAGLRGLDALSAQRAAALAERVAALAGLPVMVGVPRLYLEQMASVSQFCALPPGVDVLVQGAPAHAFYAVVSGRVLVHRDGEAVVRLGPGDSFGERGLLDNAPRNATVTTELETRLLRVEGDALIDVLEASASLRPALERSSSAPGIGLPTADADLVDDQRWPVPV